MMDEADIATALIRKLLPSIPGLSSRRMGEHIVTEVSHDEQCAQIVAIIRKAYASRRTALEAVAKAAAGLRLHYSPSDSGGYWEARGRLCICLDKLAALDVAKEDRPAQQTMGVEELLARLYMEQGEVARVVANICDEELDTTGALLGRVREAAAKGAG